MSLRAEDLTTRELKKELERRSEKGEFVLNTEDNAILSFQRDTYSCTALVSFNILGFKFVKRFYLYGEQIKELIAFLSVVDK